MTRWFEDIHAGDRFDLGEHTFTLGEIEDFSVRYDPQYFHVDEEAAKHSHFGGIVASGWLTVCVGHKMMVDTLAAEEERLLALGEKPGVSGPSPGVNEMEFKAPVRPGDTVIYTLFVEGTRLSQSIPAWGLIFNRLDAVNQDGELVYSARFAGFSKRRDYRPGLKDFLGRWAQPLAVLGSLIKR